MNKTAAVTFTVSALLMATVATTRAETVRIPSTSETTQNPLVPPAPQSNGPQSRTLFKIAGVPVHLWAPVEAPYDANMDRTAAANPIWEDGDS
ncbi:MAG TPA: hypothetical protein VHU42_14890 [Rhodopila sp.]|jgi:hypothetical protein|nr:hypothetical protein [Rhodopila sp.]